MEVVKEVENKLLKRKELIVSFDSPAVTLSRKDVTGQLAKKFKVDEKLIIVENIDQKYRSEKTEALVFIYEDEKVLKQVTNGFMYKRNNVEVPAEGEEAQ